MLTPDLRGMAETFLISSATDESALVFEALDAQRFTAHLRSAGLQATVVVASAWSEGLAHLFASFAEDWRGWEGTRTWSSCDGEIELTATADRGGHVQLIVELRTGGSPSQWHVRATLALEVNQLDRLAQAAAHFEQTVLRAA